MSMPSYWYDPMAGGGANIGASQGAALDASMKAQQAQQAAMLAQTNSYNPWANTPGGFGAQTAYYAGQGAAYGRAVPASSPAAVAAQNPSASVFDTGAAPFNHYGGVGGLQLFDPNKYLSQNKDVWAAGADPWEHYNQFGAKEGRQGTFGDFNTGGYLAQNPDVAASGMDPTAHWFNFGQKEGRQGSGFEPWLGAANTPAQQQQQPAFDMASFFDRNEYLRQNQDVAAAHIDPWQHYQQYGQKEGRANPGDNFNYAEYLAENPDVLAAGVDPFTHWNDFGFKEGRHGGYEMSSQNRPGGTGDSLLAAQRRAFGETVNADPNLKFQLAARLVKELQDDPQGRMGIYEAMLNRMNATGQNPLNPKYYPTDKGAYNTQVENKLRNDPALLNQVYGEMDRVYGGSNVSNYATDWGMDAGPGQMVATEARKYSTPTWNSPGSTEEFFRKDLPTADSTGKSWAGLGNVAKNLKWYQSVTSLPY